MTHKQALRAGLAALGLSLAGLAATSVASAQDTKHGDPKLAAQAKIKPDAARIIALRTQTGTIASWELEKEAGGSGLRYSFDIESGGKIHEVGVDAADGKVLENVVETAEDEAREARADKAGAAKPHDQEDEEEADDH